jgi:hypothetical protein
MTANGQSTEHRHSAIVTSHAAIPGLSYEAIGAQFGVSSSCVSQIISGTEGVDGRFSDRPDRSQSRRLSC